MATKKSQEKKVPVKNKPPTPVKRVRVPVKKKTPKKKQTKRN